MKPIIVALLLVAGLWAGEGLGQVDTVWFRTYGDSLLREYGTFIIGNQDNGGFVLVGHRYNDVHNISELLLVQVDSLGQQVRMISLDPIEQNWTSLYVIAVQEERVLIVVQTEYIPFIFITSIDGELINSVSLDSGRVLSAVEFNNSVYIASVTSQGQVKVEVFNMNDNSCSDLQFERPNDRPLSEFRFMFECGNDLFFCYIMRWGDPEGPSDRFVIYSLNGDGSLSGVYGTERIPKGLISTTNGNKYLYGDRFIRGGGHNIFVTKLDSEFQELWSSTYGTNNHELCVKLIEQNDGSLIALTINEGSGGLLKLDQEGDSLWMCDLGLPENYSSYRNLYAVNNRELVIIGDQSDGEGHYDMFLLKLILNDLSVNTSVLYLPQEQLISAYPNPFNSTLNIGFTSPINREATGLFIVDPLGREVWRMRNAEFGMRNGTQRVVWNAEGLPAGKYVIYLEAGTTRSAKTVALVK